MYSAPLQTRQIVDVYGIHGLTCKFSSGRSIGHTEVNKIIQRTLVTTDHPSIRKPLGVTGDACYGTSPVWIRWQKPTFQKTAKNAEKRRKQRKVEAKKVRFFWQVDIFYSSWYERMALRGLPQARFWKSWENFLMARLVNQEHTNSSVSV